MARLAQALDGDLKAMLEMAQCLPQVILDRINAQEPQAASSLKRTAGAAENAPDEPISGMDHVMVTRITEIYGLDNVEASALAQAIEGLVSLEKTQRSSVVALISSLSAQEGTAG